MKQYKETIQAILDEGVWELNERTGIEVIKLPYPAVQRFHMKDGFPALTGRRAPFKSAVGELIGFIRGVTSAFDFRDLGCKFWDQNANENAQWLANAYRKGEDDLGDVYGAQWRRWPAFKRLKPADFGGVMDDDSKWHELSVKLHKDGWNTIHSNGDTITDLNDLEFVFFKEVDQLGDCVRKIITNPSDRRILFHAWNPAKLDEIALPACHLLYQFVPTPATKELALSLTIRSNDMPLGFPSNVMEAAALLHLVARLTGYTPTWLTIVSNDAHIYRNQMDMVNEYMARPLQALPTFHMSGVIPTRTWFEENYPKDMVADEAVKWLDRIEPTQLTLSDYTPGDPISAPMAV